MKKIILNDISDVKVTTTLFKNLSDLNFLCKSTNNETTIFEIAEEFDKSCDKEVKSRLYNKMKEMVSHSSISQLIKYMKSPTELVRSISAKQLSESQFPNLLACIKQMLNDNSVSLKLSCLETLFHMNLPESISLYESALEDTNPKIRLKAAIGLAELAYTQKNKEAITILNNAIDDPDTEVRDFIIDELALIGNDKSLVKLIDLLGTSPDNSNEKLCESFALMLS